MLPDVIRQWFAEAAQAIRAIDASAVARAAEALTRVRDTGGTIYIAGNGGSASTASHLALDLQKAARSKQGAPPTRALALSDNVGLITAWGNDTSFERVFAEQLEVLARPGDALVVISVSGSSPNLLHLLETAKRHDVVTVGLLGKAAPGALIDYPIRVPSTDYGWVESAHVVLHHVLTYALRDASRLTPAGRVD